MDEQELLQELDNFLNEKGLYNEFLNWAEKRGFDVDELDSDYGRLIG
jgi:hypothetical protein